MVSFFSGIRNKFIVIYLLFGLLPLLAISYHTFHSASGALERLATAQLTNLTAKTANQARQLVGTVEKDIKLLSGYPFIQLAFLQFSFGQQLETVANKLASYKHQSGLYARISLISLEGEVILTVPEADRRVPPAQVDAGRLKLAALVDSYTSGVLPDHPEGPLIVFTKRVYDFENASEPVGLLAFYVDLQTLTRYIGELDASLGARGFIFDHNLGRFLQETPLPFDPTGALFPAGEGGPVRIAEAQDFKLFFADIPALSWTLGITLPQEVLLGDITRLRQKGLTFALSIAVLAMLTTLFFVRRITDPIARLIRGAQAFSEGDLDHRIEIGGEGEMCRLGEEFNAMATKIKAREKQIREVDRLASVGILAAGVAHEVRNPLAGMKSCAQLMQRKAISTEVGVLAQGINEEIDRLDKIVRQLLDFARPKEAAPQPVQLEQIINKVLEMTHKTLQAEGIEVHAQLDPAPSVLVDADQVHQIVLNLVLNAAQAMQGGGQLHVRQTVAGEKVAVTIADTGCGIAAEHLEHIFDPFFTLNPGGTGLGLSVVHSLMVENRIEWTLQSTPGEGTVFELHFANPDHGRDS